MNVLDVATASSTCQQFSRVSERRALGEPNLLAWSIKQADVAEVTGLAREDYERELRISALDVLMRSPVATPLWRRVCKHAMYSEIRVRSADRRLVMELAIQESMR
ncbi:hypothetical protein POK33_08935 [Burkholderia cenocepacia]|uniref:hypothetical protein n=1 Tax=Burkholderia cenocepacia TaxID=95486 RepID=UPI0023B9413B|nr:hypothetical protein [Burkholderia cenocepacia]MDF0500854.1 hypothetical protein [Burkholderia cenocepacia]